MGRKLVEGGVMVQLMIEDILLQKKSENWQAKRDQTNTSKV